MIGNSDFELVAIRSSIQKVHCRPYGLSRDSEIDQLSHRRPNIKYIYI